MERPEVCHHLTPQPYSASGVPAGPSVLSVTKPRASKDTFNVDFIVAAKRLPPWEENNPSVRGTFAEFFARWGTDIALGYSLGARYQLQITRPDASSESKNNFRTHIDTEFAPIIGKDEGPKDTTQYREYLGRLDRGFCVLGGHPQIADALARNPTERRLFDNWLRSIDLGEQNDIINNQVGNICNLFTGSPIQEYMLIGKKLELAWKFHSRLLTATGIFKVMESVEQQIG
ncbi:hypothetical protein AtubIFM55763_005484 [Aspergillus tubingensis]|uniref:Uncharacterized protein n=1 Tax=Aspergillus tubingensis TaxID=5068 RepID=A0A8H3SLB1_ASPTU|nr:SpoC1-C1C protein fragment [Aspergillus tubingensis]GFN11747.1 SpoC1-C1C protein fragment [Aspergillus tubingensis]GLA58506.1 hypothetical protein AtubIFM54640_008608 [Aspergillus tubingensis]GLA74248.1 hypothetical protein AtubIFM55763_005484 [Aspergillus tubingensis]GLA85064.1 hypothetical protein AtubIFM56815_009288 [Aspergillus tubingensis]